MRLRGIMQLQIHLFSSLVPSPSLPPFYPNLISFSSSSIANDGGTKRRSRCCSPPGALEKESQFDVDRDKAREALEKLDQQLQTLSQRETLPPKSKKRPSSASYTSSDSYLDNGLPTSRIEEMPELSGSYLAYSVVALLIITIFNNILFNLFIRPSVDGNDEPAPSIVREAESGFTVQQAPTLVEQE